MNDGRHIDASLGVLEGEAAAQVAQQSQRTEPGPTGETGVSYYGRPVLKEPVWIWSIPAYFFVGGVAGAAMTLGMAAQLAGGPRLRGFDERCRWIGAVGGAIGSALLIHDLGRKGRFLFMLRVFRPTSPMSVGSWVLALATPLSAGSALLTFSRGPLYQAGYTAGIFAGLLGMPLSTYTAVLLANTAVPLWSETRRALPLLFGASSAASLASLLDCMNLDVHERAIVWRFGLAGRMAELAASRAVVREASRVPRVGKPLKEGVSGALWTAAGVLTAGSLALSVWPDAGRARRRAAGVLGMLGGLCLRFAVFHAGKASARDPHAAFEQQR
jgi:formate-dependent nitrite reductase membrane component NrfD